MLVKKSLIKRKTGNNRNPKRHQLGNDKKKREQKGTSEGRTRKGGKKEKEINK
jgi:hypothetical protein